MTIGTGISRRRFYVWNGCKGPHIHWADQERDYDFLGLEILLTEFLQECRPLRGEYFESIEAVRKFLTDVRLELRRTIRDQKPDSISELAQLVKRNFADVHRDIGILVEVGLADQLHFEVA